MDLQYKSKERFCLTVQQIKMNWINSKFKDEHILDFCVEADSGNRNDIWMFFWRWILFKIWSVLKFDPKFTRKSKSTAVKPHVWEPMGRE